LAETTITKKKLLSAAKSTLLTPSALTKSTNAIKEFTQQRKRAKKEWI
jgi:hypothetical protein